MWVILQHVYQALCWRVNTAKLFNVNRGLSRVSECNYLISVVYVRIASKCIKLHLAEKSSELGIVADKQTATSRRLEQKQSGGRGI
jgi:hypothetical protein